MKIAVIHYRSKPTLSSSELLYAIEELGHMPIYIKIHELDAHLLNGSIIVEKFNEPIQIDGGIIRSIGYSLSTDMLARRIGVLEALASYATLINDPSTIMYTRDKWRSLLRLAKEGLPVPETIITENPYTAKSFCEKCKRVVFKPLMGSLGLGSTLVTDPDIAFHITRSLANMGITSYYQEYLEKPGFDFRVFVVGDQVIGAMKRVVSSGWKTNIARGARGVKITEEEYPEVFKLALKATQILGLDYAGVDIAFDKQRDKYYILEVNAYPQWQGLKTATGVNVAKHIVSYLINKIRR
ncbi:MAG: RimK family alpha-L-glutamate ligase [Thermoprotei archaeon]